MKYSFPFAMGLSKPFCRPMANGFYFMGPEQYEAAKYAACTFAPSKDLFKLSEMWDELNRLGDGA
ncbi:hypothetical protein [Hydrogenophaga sp.]|uniref:hypothetical protein n=1 Tax=Hydrogenophaga sp. TaxID=1904254 RepID=UPI002722A990|nr:hypothetical protein [Hydrogenophaga sp.]MDO9606367.1 hypothetical protein [Hydrogenophaga sp.]